jgi:hypothetical protein
MFNEKKYQPIKEILSPDIVSLVTQYALLDEMTNYTAEGTNEQVPGAHSRYADILMESLLMKLKSSIEFVTDKKLLPTYSYYRVYRPGHDLKPHTDRPACEYSVTVSFGQNYQNETGKYSWPMFVEGTPVHLEPGDAIVYKGCEANHWREKFSAPEYSYHIQGFFHYVDENGPYASEVLDKRTFIGQPKTPNLKQNIPNKSYIIAT